MKLSENFYLSEFESSDGSETPCDVLENLKELAKQLQVIREFTGLPIKVNSGYRSPDWNQYIGGASKSQHLLGKAADIVIQGMKPLDTYALLEFLIGKGKIKDGGLGKYNSFTHYDIRDKHARWDNT